MNDQYIKDVQSGQLKCTKFRRALLSAIQYKNSLNGGGDLLDASLSSTLNHSLPLSLAANNHSTSSPSITSKIKLKPVIAPSPCQVNSVKKIPKRTKNSPPKTQPPQVVKYESLKQLSSLSHHQTKITLPTKTQAPLVVKYESLKQLSNSQNNNNDDTNSSRPFSSSLTSGNKPAKSPPSKSSSLAAPVKKMSSQMQQQLNGSNNQATSTLYTAANSSVYNQFKLEFDDDDLSSVSPTSLIENFGSGTGDDFGASFRPAASQNLLNDELMPTTTASAENSMYQSHISISNNNNNNNNNKNSNNSNNNNNNNNNNNTNSTLDIEAHQYDNLINPNQLLMNSYECHQKQQQSINSSSSQPIAILNAFDNAQMSHLQHPVRPTVINQSNKFNMLSSSGSLASSSSSSNYHYASNNENCHLMVRDEDDEAESEGENNVKGGYGRLAAANDIVDSDSDTSLTATSLLDPSTFLKFYF